MTKEVVKFFKCLGLATNREKSAKHASSCLEIASDASEVGVYKYFGITETSHCKISTNTLERIKKKDLF